MRKRRSLSCGKKALLAAVPFLAAAWGCGSDSPTELGPASLPDLFGSHLLRVDGTKVGVGTLESTALIGIYFAYRSCSVCNTFTPILVDAYQQLRQDGRSFEVILVSPGVSNSSLLSYMADSEMPWLGMPSEGKKSKDLIRRYNVQWVPTLVIIDGSARTVSLTGREDLNRKGIAAYDDWMAISTGG